MAEDVRQAKDDIAYIKGFLKGDGPAPVLIAHFYVLIGVIAALVALSRYAIEEGWTLPGFLTAYAPWAVYGLVLIGVAISSTVLWRQRKSLHRARQQDLSAGTRASNAAWYAVTVALGVGVVCLQLSGIEELPVAELILFCMLWCVGWSVTYAVHRVGWHRLVALGFLVFAVAVAKAAGAPVLLLLVAAGGLLLFTVPGYLIIRAARGEK